MKPTNLYIDTKQLAEWLGLTEDSLVQERTRGTGPPYIRVLDSEIRYEVAAIKAWLEARTVKPTVSLGAPGALDKQINKGSAEPKNRYYHKNRAARLEYQRQYDLNKRALKKSTKSKTTPKKKRIPSPEQRARRLQYNSMYDRANKDRKRELSKQRYLARKGEISETRWQEILAALPATKPTRRNGKRK